MKQRLRIIIALTILVVILGVVLGVETWRRQQATVLEPGAIPVYVNGRLAGQFREKDRERLEMVSFVDDEEGKTQEGWMLRDALLLIFDRDELRPETQVIVSSSSQDKSASLTWAEIASPEAMVMFDLSGRGTLKLVSRLERLDTRNEWVQDVDKIEVTP
ncbi:MAG: hypothetical protein JXA21_19280 [Anaerolineae bacterium]|nr:hypothetical protein [Anaerolineae bacterium]